MDPERWPDPVRAFVDQIGTKTPGAIIEVDYLTVGYVPLWRIRATCPCCRVEVHYGITAPPPKPGLSEPAWYRKLEDLPPGGTP